jgi:hypothetical protein
MEASFNLKQPDNLIYMSTHEDLLNHHLHARLNLEADILGEVHFIRGFI